MKHIKGLDTLRAFAVFFVLVAHWGMPNNGVEPPAEHIFQHFFVPDGAAGVYLFFVLSGFLITGILLNARISNHNSKDRLLAVKNFVIRRALRIFPIYYLFMFILYKIQHDTNENLTYLLTYTVNFACFFQNRFVTMMSHTWTLSIEEQFYLFWPWLILFVNSKYLKYVFAAAIGIGLLSTYITCNKYIIEPFLVSDCLDAFGIGALYAYARLSSENTKRFEKIVKRIVPFCIALYAYWKIAVFVHYEPHEMWLYKTSCSIISIWLIMLAMKPRTGKAAKWFWENKFLNFVGKISYAFYLIHPFMYYLEGVFVRFVNDRIVHNPFWHDLLTARFFLYWFNFACLLLICQLSYLLIERPLLNLKKYFNYKQKEAASPNGQQ